VKDDETIYPPPAVMATLYTISAADQKYNQLRTRTWTTIKTGK